MALTVEDLLVEAEVRRVVLRYCRGVDRLDRELVRSCYHPGATDSHGNFEGTVDEFIDWAFGLLTKATRTMHLVGNVLVERTADPDVATCESYAVAYHHRAGGQPHHNLTNGFRYVDRFERRAVPGGERGGEPEWRIARRVVVTEWVQDLPPEAWWPIPEGFEVGRRDGTDAIDAIGR